MNYQLLISVALLATVFSTVDAAGNNGSVLRITTRSLGMTDQVRILTKPRAGYNLAVDTPTVLDFTDPDGVLSNTCADSTIIDYITDPVDESNCCKMPSFNGFNLWPEKQGVSIANGNNIIAEDLYSPVDGTVVFDGNSCKERDDKSGKNTAPLDAGIYNSYMGQSYDPNKQYVDNVVEFPNQDVIAIIWETSTIHATDAVFAIGGESTYNNVRNDNWRGLEPGDDVTEGFELNCEAMPSCPPVETVKGSVLRIRQTSYDMTDQTRILTQPRPGYDPVTDTPIIHTYGYGPNNICTDSSFDFVGPIDNPNVCCKMESLKGFNLWEEEQGYTVGNGDSIIPSDNFLPNAKCFERRNMDDLQNIPLMEGTVVNSYMAQGWNHDIVNGQNSLQMDNVIEFPNQDIIGIIWDKQRIVDTDQYFELGTGTYDDVRNGVWRGLEPTGDDERYQLNCDSGRHNCPRVHSGSHGDPHFRTWKQEHFEFHGQCDMVLVKDEDFADGLGLEVQIRTKLVRFWSFIKTASIRIGNDILQIEGSYDDHEAHYWINFEYQAEMDTIGGFPVTMSRKGFKKRFYEIDLGSKFPGQKIILSTYREFIKVDFEGHTAKSFGNVVGLLGDYNTGKTVARDGVTEIHNFEEYGQEWQVLPSDPKLFNEIVEPHFPNQCILPEDPRGDRKRRLEESDISIEQAEVACSMLKDPLDVKDCVYDVLATQDLDMVGAF